MDMNEILLDLYPYGEYVARKSTVSVARLGIPRSDLKGVTLPPVYEGDFGDSIGGVHQIGSEEFPNGVIAINSRNDDGYYTTLVHELRHAMQYDAGCINASIWLEPDADYREMIVSYFTTQWFEYDALAYQKKVGALVEHEKEWIEWVAEAMCSSTHMEVLL